MLKQSNVQVTSVSDVHRGPAYHDDARTLRTDDEQLYRDEVEQSCDDHGRPQDSFQGRANGESRPVEPRRGGVGFFERGCEPPSTS